MTPANRNLFIDFLNELSIPKKIQLYNYVQEVLYDGDELIELNDAEVFDDIYGGGDIFKFLQAAQYGAYNVDEPYFIMQDDGNLYSYTDDNIEDEIDCSVIADYFLDNWDDFNDDFQTIWKEWNRYETENGSKGKAE